MYRTLSAAGNPELSSLAAMGMRLTVRPIVEQTT
jgi:DNA-binding phage protein